METILRSAAVGILVLALALAVASDLGTRTIPNGCVAAVALCAAPTVTYADDLACAAARSLAGAAAVLALLLAARGLSRKLHGSAGIGAGDIKLLSALGLWAGPVGGLAIVGASCVIALIGRAAAQRSREAASFAALRRGTPMPMAPAIAAAAALTFAFGLWGI